MVQLPAASLPSDQMETIVLAEVLKGLHLLEEQDLDVRAAYPVRWHMLWDQGMTDPLLENLLPKDLLGETRPDPNLVIPQRTLGALRRQLDRLATQWDVKYTQETVQALAEEGATAMYNRVMDEAKRVQTRKRTQPADATPEASSSNCRMKDSEEL